MRLAAPRRAVRIQEAVLSRQEVVHEWESCLTEEGGLGVDGGEGGGGEDARELVDCPEGLRVRGEGGAQEGCAEEGGGGSGIVAVVLRFRLAAVAREEGEDARREEPLGLRSR